MFCHRKWHPSFSFTEQYGTFPYCFIVKKEYIKTEKKNQHKKIKSFYIQQRPLYLRLQSFSTPNTLSLKRASKVLYTIPHQKQDWRWRNILFSKLVSWVYLYSTPWISKNPHSFPTPLNSFCYFVISQAPLEVHRK